MLEGADKVEFAGEVVEGVALPEVEDADEEGDEGVLPLARMYGADSSKNDSLKNFRAISLSRYGGKRGWSKCAAVCIAAYLSGGRRRWGIIVTRTGSVA